MVTGRKIRTVRRNDPIRSCVWLTVYEQAMSWSKTISLFRKQRPFFLLRSSVLSQNLSKYVEIFIMSLRGKSPEAAPFCPILHYTWLSLEIVCLNFAALGHCECCSSNDCCFDFRITRATDFPSLMRIFPSSSSLYYLKKLNRNGKTFSLVRQSSFLTPSMSKTFENDDISERLFPVTFPLSFSPESSFIFVRLS